MRLAPCEVAGPLMRSWADVLEFQKPSLRQASVIFSSMVLCGMHAERVLGGLPVTTTTSIAVPSMFETLKPFKTRGKSAARVKFKIQAGSIAEGPTWVPGLGLTEANAALRNLNAFDRWSSIDMGEFAWERHYAMQNVVAGESYTPVCCRLEIVDTDVIVSNTVAKTIRRVDMDGGTAPSLRCDLIVEKVLGSGEKLPEVVYPSLVVVSRTQRFVSGNLTFAVKYSWSGATDSEAEASLQDHAPHIEFFLEVRNIQAQIEVRRGSIPLTSLGIVSAFWNFLDPPNSSALSPLRMEPPAVSHHIPVAKAASICFASWSDSGGTGPEDAAERKLKVDGLVPPGYFPVACAIVPPYLIGGRKSTAPRGSRYVMVAWQKDTATPTPFHFAWAKFPFNAVFRGEVVFAVLRSCSSELPPIATAPQAPRYLDMLRRHASTVWGLQDTPLHTAAVLSTWPQWSAADLAKVMKHTFVISGLDGEDEGLDGEDEEEEGEEEEDDSSEEEDSEEDPDDSGEDPDGSDEDLDDPEEDDPDDFDDDFNDEDFEYEDLDYE